MVQVRSRVVKAGCTERLVDCFRIFRGKGFFRCLLFFVFLCFSLCSLWLGSVGCCFPLCICFAFSLRSLWLKNVHIKKTFMFKRPSWLRFFAGSPVRIFRGECFSSVS